MTKKTTVAFSLPPGLKTLLDKMRRTGESRSALIVRLIMDGMGLTNDERVEIYEAKK